MKASASFVSDSVTSPVPSVAHSLSSALHLPLFIHLYALISRCHSLHWFAVMEASASEWMFQILHYQDFAAFASTFHVFSLLT